jgi:iron(III) transport system permease protein
MSASTVSFNPARLWPWGLWSIFSLGVLALFVAYPIGVLTWNALLDPQGRLSLGGFATVLTEAQYLEAIRNTIVLGIIVTCTSTLVGVPLAYVMARYDFPLKGVVAILPIVTIIIPEVIVGQSWLMMLGNNGLISNWLNDLLSAQGLAVPSFYGWSGMVFSMTLIYYTYVYLGTLAALRGFDGQLEEASLSLGASPFMTRLKVMLPTVAPAMLVNGLVVFTLVVGNFALSSLLGGQIPLLSVMTYSLFVSEMGNSPVLQSSLSVVMIAIVALVLFFQKRVVERRQVQMTQGRAPAPVRAKSWQGVLLASLAVGVVALSLVPLVAVFAGAFTQARGPVMHWGKWSTQSIERALSLAPEPILNSLMFAASATVLGTALALMVSYLVVKKKSRLSGVLDYVVVLPLTISGTVLGIALVQSFNTGPLVLTGTAAIMIVCYMVRRLPFGVRNASSVLYNLPGSMEEASISLGVSPFKTFFKVVLPVMKTSMLSAAILMWATSISELSASIVVYSGGLETLPIAIYRLVDTGRLGLASAYGAVLVVLILVPVGLAAKFLKVNLFSVK